MESSGCAEQPQGAAEEGSLLFRVKQGGAEVSERVTLPNRAGSRGCQDILSKEVSQGDKSIGCDDAL